MLLTCHWIFAYHMNVLCESLPLCCSGRLDLDFCLSGLYCDVQGLYKACLKALLVLAMVIILGWWLVTTILLCWDIL